MDEEFVKKPGLLKNLAFSGQLTRLTVYFVVSVPAAIFIILALLVQFGTISPLEISGIPFGTSVDFILFAVFISTGTFGIYEFMRVKRVRKIDERFPDFVRDLAESRRAGMTFTKAIMYSSKGNYGVLTTEIQKIARQISWGSSVDNALAAFSKRVNTKLIRRTISLINEASKSGGNVADVLDAASRDARELKLLDSERRAGMMSYVAVVYVGVGVFLLIIFILCNNLLPAMLGSGSQGVGSAMGSGVVFTKEDVVGVFFAAALFQSVGMGIVTGVFEEGSVISGVKHVFILLITTWVMFKFFIGI